MRMLWCKPQRGTGDGHAQGHSELGRHVADCPAGASHEHPPVDKHEHLRESEGKVEMNGCGAG